MSRVHILLMLILHTTGSAVRGLRVLQQHASTPIAPVRAAGCPPPVAFLQKTHKVGGSEGLYWRCGCPTARLLLSKRVRASGLHVGLVGQQYAKGRN